LVLDELQFGLQRLQVLLRGDVVVDRVEDLCCDPLGLLAIDIGVRQSVGQRKSAQLSRSIAFKAG